MQRLTVWLISLYQRTLSPDHGWGRLLSPYAGCRFHPSCSEYARQAIMRYGAVRGAWAAIRRVARCNPWSAGGIDFVK